jgi:hypothetical protein
VFFVDASPTHTLDRAREKSSPQTRPESERGEAVQESDHPSQAALGVMHIECITVRLWL